LDAVYNDEVQDHMKSSEIAAETLNFTNLSSLPGSTLDRARDIAEDPVFSRQFARFILSSVEHNKPIDDNWQGLLSIVMDYFADNGKVFTTDEVINTDARKSTVAFEPIGVIGSIMPWNFPYWQALRFAAPSLMVGNTIVLKPASATMGCGAGLEYLMGFFKR
jgi:hypothetical protein